jgi:CHASE3 domain sensor protein
MTTSENREEFARILAKIESLPADAPVYPEGLVEAYAEIDRVLAVMDEREAAAS